MEKSRSQLEEARVGDWVETRSVSGQGSRRGQIVELIGRGLHTRYVVRWDESHASIVYPADGVRIIHETSEYRAIV